MSLAQDLLQQLERLTPFGRLPAVRALHLPPPPLPGGTKGEFCALELEDGSVGLSYVLLGNTWAELAASDLCRTLPGQDALTVAQGFAQSDGLQRTVGFAAVNALTRWLFNRSDFAPPASADSIGHLDPQPGETVGMIGHFTPLIPRITERGARLLIAELREDLVGERDGVRVTLDAGELAPCRKLLATGTLLLNDTLEAMLAHAPAARQIALIGPSVGCPPDALFARGVTFLGGSWITDPPAYLAALCEGRSAGNAARKFGLTTTQYPGWEALLARL